MSAAVGSCAVLSSSARAIKNNGTCMEDRSLPLEPLCHTDGSMTCITTHRFCLCVIKIPRNDQQMPKQASDDYEENASDASPL